MIKVIKKYDITTYIDYDDLLEYLKKSNKSFNNIEDVANNYIREKSHLKIEEEKTDSILILDENEKKTEKLNFYLTTNKYNL